MQPTQILYGKHNRFKVGGEGCTLSIFYQSPHILACLKYKVLTTQNNSDCNCRSALILCMVNVIFIKGGLKPP